MLATYLDLKDEKIAGHTNVLILRLKTMFFEWHPEYGEVKWDLLYCSVVLRRSYIQGLSGILICI